MPFKYISYLELWQLFCSAERNHLCKLFEFRPVVKEKMSFKDISYLELWQPFCSEEKNHLCNFGSGCYTVQFCEIILILGQCFRRCRLKYFLYGALVALLFSGVEPFVQF